MLGVKPSYATGFAQWPGMSEYPQLWTGLVGAWAPFLGATGNKVFDLSGNGNIGTLVNDTHFVPGKFGPALDFDGSDYVDKSDNFGLDIIARPMSLFAWINITSGSSTGYLFCRNDVGFNDVQYGMYWSTDDDYLISVLEGTDRVFSAGSSIPVGSWHHVGFTWASDGTVQNYVDGVASGSSASYTGALTSRPTISIGRRVNSVYITAQIDLPIVYNRAPSASEIALLYQLRKRLVA